MWNRCRTDGSLSQQMMVIMYWWMKRFYMSDWILNCIGCCWLGKRRASERSFIADLVFWNLGIWDLAIGQGGRHPSVLLVRLNQRTERFLGLATAREYISISKYYKIIIEYSPTYRVNSFAFFGLRVIRPWPLTTLAANCMMTASTV